MKTTHTSISGVLSMVAAIVLYPFLLAYAGAYRLVRRLVREAWRDGKIHGLSPEKRRKVLRMLDIRRNLSYVLTEAESLVGRSGCKDRDVLRRLGRSAGRDLKKVQRWLQFRHFINKGDVVKLSEQEARLFRQRFC